MPAGVTKTTAPAATFSIGGIYNDSACTSPANEDSLTIGTMYYYTVVIDITNPGVFTTTTMNAASLATAVVGVVSITFNISFVATPVAE